jgi:hypothetical protein
MSGAVHPLPKLFISNTETKLLFYYFQTILFHVPLKIRDHISYTSDQVQKFCFMGPWTELGFE